MPADDHIPLCNLCHTHTDFYQESFRNTRGALLEHGSKRSFVQLGTDCSEFGSDGACGAPRKAFSSFPKPSQWSLRQNTGDRAAAEEEAYLVSLHFNDYFMKLIDWMFTQSFTDRKTN